MNLFCSPGSYERPAADKRPKAWMLYHSLTERSATSVTSPRTDIFWPLLRRYGLTKTGLDELVEKAWAGTGGDGRCESGPWGIYAAQAGNPLRFEWGQNHRGFFSGARQSITGDAVRVAIRRVMEIPRPQRQAQRWPERLPIRRFDKHVGSPGWVQRRSRPPMSVRHAHQSGARPLSWPAPPPRTPPPIRPPERARAGIANLLRRGSSEGKRNETASEAQRSQEPIGSGA
jgi:hypothetical protein